MLCAWFPNLQENRMQKNSAEKLRLAKDADGGPTTVTCPTGAAAEPSMETRRWSGSIIPAVVFSSSTCNSSPDNSPRKEDSVKVAEASGATFQLLLHIDLQQLFVGSDGQNSHGRYRFICDPAHTM